jgi:hypothetical protein
MPSGDTAVEAHQNMPVAVRPDRALRDRPEGMVKVWRNWTRHRVRSRRSRAHAGVDVPVHMGTGRIRDAYGTSSS